MTKTGHKALPECFTLSTEQTRVVNCLIYHAYWNGKAALSYIKLCGILFHLCCLCPEFNSVNTPLFGITVWIILFVVALLCQLCSLWAKSYCDRLRHIKNTQVCLKSINKRKKKQRAGVGAGGRDMKRRWRAKMRAVLSKTAALHHKNNKWRLSLLLRS